MVVRRMNEFGEIIPEDRPLDQYQENYIFYVEPKAPESRWIREFDVD